VNFSLNQIVVPEGNLINPPIWQMLPEAIASAAHSPDQSCLGLLLYRFLSLKLNATNART
jgi:hypothetical protein